MIQYRKFTLIEHQRKLPSS